MTNSQKPGKLLPFLGSDTQVISPWLCEKSQTWTLVRANTTGIQASFLTLQSYAKKKEAKVFHACQSSESTNFSESPGGHSKKGSMCSLGRWDLDIGLTQPWRARDLFSKPKPFCLLEEGVSVSKCCAEASVLQQKPPPYARAEEGVGNVNKMH